jgi:RES domain-containing protein
VSPVRRARTPRTALYRIGRRPDPLAWPPWEYVGSGRFDDPAGEFRVLYATVDRRTAFLETLAHFRLSRDVLAALKAVENTDEPFPRPRVPADWYHTRAIGRLRLATRQRWVDLRSFETRESLRRELARSLLELELEDLDLSGVIGPRRRLTQIIARWAYEHGYAGLVYSSRFNAAFTCWAIFESAVFDPVGIPEPILPGDPGLVWAARSFGLAI